MPNQLTRRSALLAAASTLLGTAALAQNKPITIIVPYAPGGSADLVTRVIAQFAAPAVGAPLIVDNRTGGGGIVGWAPPRGQIRTATPC